MTDLITTDLTPIPSRQTPSTFSTDADTLLGKLPAWSSEANALATGVNALATGVNTNAVTAATQATIATESALSAASSANYEGEWDDLTGSAVIPYSVSNNSSTYQLILALADVTTVEPGVTAGWGTYWSLIDDRSGTQIADASLGTGTHTFNYASGSMQQLTATGSITLAITGFVSGKVCSFVFDAVDFGAVTITHPAAWLFAAGTAPTYTTAGTDRILLWHDKDDVVTLHIGDQDIKVVA